MDIVAGYSSGEEIAVEVMEAESKRDSSTIDLIDLDESDNDFGISNSPKISKPKEEKEDEGSAKAKKNFDYLHLESSDSEEEQQRFQLHESVEQLLRSAALLSDKIYDPEKPTSSDKESDSDPEIICISDTPAPTPKEPDPPKEKITHLKLSDLSEWTYDMYRDDERLNDPDKEPVACHYPDSVLYNYVGHTSMVTALEWCIPRYSYLFLSASADCSLKVWDIHCKKAPQDIKCKSALKAAKWFLNGEQVVMGGHGNMAHVVDVLSGEEITSYEVYNTLSSLSMYPHMEDVFLCGTKNAVLGFDLRVNTKLPIRTFYSKCEEILDIAFSNCNKDEFICSTNIVSKDSADRTIIVWDFGSGAVMSRQIYLERYTCPSLKVHPSEFRFVAQTNGDYIATFSTKSPYKIRDMRYMGHKVAGYGIECEISPDGKFVASGDANGNVFFYDFKTAGFTHKTVVKSNVPLNRLKWHPILPSTMVTATWDGQIQVLK